MPDGGCVGFGEAVRIEAVAKWPPSLGSATGRMRGPGRQLTVATGRIAVSTRGCRETGTRAGRAAEDLPIGDDSITTAGRYAHLAPDYLRESVRGLEL